ncbi:MAG: type II toxin-antitoxin system RelE/ParE family toxin [Geminicoccaceae bacterium]
MSYKIKFHPAVRRDLEAIAELIGEFAGRDVARRKIREITQTIQSLATTPHIGSIRDEIAPGLRALPAGNRGVVVFTVSDAERCVLVYAVTYGGGDWMRGTRKRR